MALISREIKFHSKVSNYIENTVITRFLRFQSVVPLNEYCGLLEWVNNTQGLRHILLRMYKERGIYFSGKELQAMTPKQESPLE